MLRITHLLLRKRYKVSIITPTRSPSSFMYCIDMLRRALMVLGIALLYQSCDVIKEYHFYVSDDREHDTLFVQHCFGLIYDSFKNNGVSFIEHWIWSDGCAGQFKSACSFYWLSCLHKETGIRHTWTFFETRDGRGEHDGAGACVKRALRRYQMSHSASQLK